MWWTSFLYEFCFSSEADYFYFSANFRLKIHLVTFLDYRV